MSHTVAIRPGHGSPERAERRREVAIEVAPAVVLSGDLIFPEEVEPRGLVAFSVVSRATSRNRYNGAIIAALQQAGFATLLFDALTSTERLSRFAQLGADTLAERLLAVTDYLRTRTNTAQLPIGYFATGAGSGAALRAAAECPDGLRAVVSMYPQPYLQPPRLEAVIAPVLVIAGGTVEDLESAVAMKSCLRCPHKLVVVPGAAAFSEGDPRPLKRAVWRATDWFIRHLTELDRHLPELDRDH